MLGSDVRVVSYVGVMVSDVGVVVSGVDVVVFVNIY